MIINARRYLKDSAYQSILVLATVGLIISLALPPALKQSGAEGNWIMKVNGTEISELTFRRKLSEQQEFLTSFKMQYGSYADMLLESMGLSSDPKELACQALVKDGLLNQVADTVGIHIHSEDIADKLHNPQFVQQELAGVIPPYFLSEGSLSENLLRRHLQRAGISLGAFQDIVAKAIQRRMVTQFAAASAYVPLFELKQRYSKDYLGKKFSIISLSYEDYLKKEAHLPISAHELETFFAKNQARYVVPEKRSGTLWTFDPVSYGFALSDKEIEDYYKDHYATEYVDQPAKVQVRRILLNIPENGAIKQVEERLQKVHKELALGEVSFEEKAKQLSDDKETAAKGGLLPPFSRGEQKTALERAAFLLKNDGDISPVFRSDEGFEILQRVSRTARTHIPLDKARQGIKKVLLKKKFKHQFDVDMQKFLIRSEDRDAQIEQFIKEQKGKRQAIHFLSFDNTSLAKNLFSIKEKGDYAFYIDGDHGYAVQLSDIQERHAPLLESIKETVRNDIYQQRAQDALGKDIARLNEVAQKEGMVHAAQQFKAKIEHTPLLKKTKSHELKELEKRGIPVSRLLQLEKIGHVVTHQADKKGYVIQLDEIESFDEADFLSKRAAILTSLEQEQVSVLIDGFIASLYRNATIETNESVINFYQEYSI